MPKAGQQDGAKEKAAPIDVHLNDHEKNATFKYPSNYISTTKYTWWNFLPLNLWWQFHKASNCFFFVNMVIALIPGVSPVFPATTVMPLVVVLTVAAARDAYEDFQRYKSDKRANASPVRLVDAAKGEVVTRQSREVMTGDVLHLPRGAEIPADCVVISTSLEDGGCFVETANLDGETNLKPKQAKLATHKAFPNAAAMAKLAGTCTCDAPNNSLTTWTAKLTVPACGSEDIPIDMDNLLLRGCLVRNVDWVLAAAVYTGVNTKMFLNLTQKPPKVSRIDTKLNRLIALILCFQQLLMVIICSLAAAWSSGTQLDGFYMRWILTETNGAGWFGLSYLTYFILLSFMMPISLFVSLEFCKTAQAKFMDWDEKMSHNGRPMAARTSSLNEELSQVQYVFSDKTGTLTENQMRFAKAFAGGQAFDELANPRSMANYLATHSEQQELRPTTIHNFLRLLALNNVVVINEDEQGKLVYDGSSPDEVALVGTATDNGYRLLSRNSESMTVEIGRTSKKYRITDILPFTPERKMMSVVVKEATGEMRLYTKGADSAVLNCLSKEASDVKMLRVAQKFLDDCAEDGLRTLACAEKVFTPASYTAWKKQWDAANLTVSGDRFQRVHEAALAAETDLTFVGCTAIEDRLQDEVPETIHFLLRCGIIVWVLTGDKRETAVNISKTSRLLNPTTDHVMHLYKPSEANGVGVAEQIERCTREAREAKGRGQKVSFVVDGFALELILHDPVTFTALRELGLLVNSAVCCRVTPLQKASVVAMFQELGHTCLGIGDGANDVSMIQEARVGIGIMGLEGSQAERASDYALPRFRFLRRLLAVHGRYSLVRNSSLIQYSFYKNLVYSMVQVYYSFYNGYSGQTIFDSWVLTFFNMAFTFLPPMVMGMFDFDVRDTFLMRYPGLYAELRSAFAVRMSRVTAFVWLMQALFHSWVIWYGTYLANIKIPNRHDGLDRGMWFDGTTVCNTLMLVVNVQAAFSFLSWTWIHAASIVLSFVAYYGFILTYASIPPATLGFATYFMVPFAVLGDPQSWASFALLFFVVVLPQLVVMTLRRRLYGTHMHYARVADDKRRKQLPWVDADEHEAPPKATTISRPPAASTGPNGGMEMRLLDDQGAAGGTATPSTQPAGGQYDSLL